MGNENPKIPRVEISKTSFKPGHIPYYKKKKLVLSGLDKYLIFAFTSLIIYTVVSLIIFSITGTEPAVLTGCFFGAFGGEILMCALIKRLKLHKEAKDDKTGNVYQ